MDPTIRQRAKGWAGSIVLLLILFTIVIVYNYVHKPLFFNHFGFDDRIPVAPIWLPYPSQVRDHAGNGFYADFRMNFLLAVNLPSERWELHVMTAETGTIDRPAEQAPPGVRFEAAPNRLTVVTAHQETRTYTIGPGEAQHLFQRIKSSDMADRMSLVRELIRKTGNAPAGR